jgi:tRNA-dihydrouridine synthase C
MTIVLAPMEGLLDAPLRDILTRVGGVDRCVSEFIRVSGTLLPNRVFTRIVPELLHASRTAAGVPVRPQLMGSDPVCLAENAAKLAALNPAGIDLNFGCPAKVVNRHGGGASLLDDPPLLAQIVGAVRRAVPASIPVSAKMRLGNEDDRRAIEAAQALADSGASEIVVHGRTRAQGYRPPAYWARINDVRQAVRIPVIANGEIWSADDAKRCRAESGCDGVMIGRGMVRDPGLAWAIQQPGHPGLAWAEVLPLLSSFWALVQRGVQPHGQAGRLKQWLNFLRRRYVQADVVFSALRTVNDPAAISQLVREITALPWSPPPRDAPDRARSTQTAL